ncbi:MAG: 4Fe-4S binding protein, partial [Candidatus Omnitrophica bacterium]|nr:4Fe-4S binding protein [Candidatus Omnitrophota bacterium]
MGVQRPQQVVYTNQARCRDCYRCVRVCPVKAIVIKDSQAFIDEDR